MKRIFILLLCFALLLSLTGCGEKSLPPSEAEPVLSVSDELADDIAPDSEEEEKNKAETLWLGDISLADNGSCSIKAVRLITFPSGEGRLELVLENKLPYRNCIFSVVALSVNGALAISDAGRFYLAPGEKTVEYVPFAYASSGLDGWMEGVAELEVRFSVQDALDEALEYVPHTVFHIYPNAKNTDGENIPSA